MRLRSVITVNQGTHYDQRPCLSSSKLSCAKFKVVWLAKQHCQRIDDQLLISRVFFSEKEINYCWPKCALK